MESQIMEWSQGMGKRLKEYFRSRESHAYKNERRCRKRALTSEIENECRYRQRHDKCSQRNTEPDLSE